ncbi:MAG TPA: hypothetical protein DEP51_03930, partial [Clostridiales bacterium]|nr:hypothetical protein [Clostridiales bacterium]
MIYLLKNRHEKKKNFKLFSYSRHSRYLKIIFTKNVIVLIIISSIISNSIVLIQNNKYEKIYKNSEGREIKINGKIVEILNEKYKVKIISKKYKSIYIYLQSKEKLEFGDEVSIYGKYELPNQARNYKGFDYREYLKTLKIIGTVKANKVTIIKNNSINYFFTKIYKLKICFSKKVNNMKLSKDEKSILKGILLGDKSEIDEEIITDFSDSNISHILAISGMHISYVILIISFVFNRLLGKHFSKIVISFFVFIYMCLTGFLVTLVRAGISGIVLIMSNFFYRKNDIWQTLSLSLIILLINNPFSILNIGLQLSYSAIIGIIIFQRLLKKYISNSLEKTNNRAIRKNQKKIRYGIKIINSKIGQIVLDSILVTISSMISIIPIIIYQFNKLPIFSIFLSILASFIIVPIIVLGLICLVFDTSFLQILLSYSLKILIFISKLGSKIPLSKIYIITPNIIFVIMYYFLVLLSFY